MAFKIKKCIHLCITLKQSLLKYSFTFNGQAIPQQKSSKYMGLTITEDLNRNTHSEHIRAKATQSLGLS